MDVPDTKHCVGCGFCCRKAPCAVATRIYGSGITSCPALEWDGNRYWCRLCKLPGNLGREYRKELAAGEGCCCGMNTDRASIPPPQEAPKMRSLPRELKVFLRHLGREFISKEAIWLALNAAEHELEDEGFRDHCLAAMMEERPAHVDDFMG